MNGGDDDWMELRVHSRDPEVVVELGKIRHWTVFKGHAC